MSTGTQPRSVLVVGEGTYGTVGAQDQLRAIKELSGLSGQRTRKQRRRLAREQLRQGRAGSLSMQSNASASRLDSMGRMSANGLRGLLLGISQPRLDQLVVDSLAPRHRGHRSRGSLRFDTSGLDALLEGVAWIDCPEVKAIVFLAAIKAQDLMEGYAEAETLAGQIAALLLQDIKGIFAALRLYDPEAQRIIAFLTMMLSNRSQMARQTLKELTTALMHGAGMCSFSEYMEQRDGDLPSSLQEPEASQEAGAEGFANAANLGYLAGATMVALSAVVVRPREQAAILNHVYLGALKAGGGVTGLAPVRKTHVELEKLGFYYMISELDKGELELLDALYNLAFPRTPKGRPSSSEEGPGLAFKESFDHIVLSWER